ncbi:TIGR04222 domain-containing membrane protein [Sphingomonas sp. RS6]
MALGPFDLPAGPFLALYLVLLALAWFASGALQRSLIPPGRAGATADIDELAVLIGGAPRLAESMAARLLADGRMTPHDKHEFRIAGTHYHGIAERKMVAMQGVVGWRDIQQTLMDTAGIVSARLVRSGLLAAPGDAWRRRFWSAAPLLVLIGFGLVKVAVGIGRDRPVGFLTALVFATAVLAAIRAARISRATRAGHALVERLRDQHERLCRGPTAAEAGLAVALFGTVVLVGSGWEALHHARAGTGDGGSGCSASSGCGGGGDGGGCGGCSS